MIITVFGFVLVLLSDTLSFEFYFHFNAFRSLGKGDSIQSIVDVIIQIVY